MPNAPFNPAADVVSNLQQVSAARWECLRRNKRFQNLAERWNSAPEARVNITEENACARCALWWMLTPDEAYTLAGELIKLGRLKMDARSNFGPINVHFTTSRLSGPLTMQSLASAFEISPQRAQKHQLSITQTWLQSPRHFRQQFTLASSGDTLKPVIHNGSSLQKAAMNFASRLLACSEAAEARALGRELLQEIADWGELSEKLIILDVGGTEFPPWQIERLFADIQKYISMLPSHHQEKRSWWGTPENWHRFVRWEANAKNYRATANDYIAEKSPSTLTTKSQSARQVNARKTIKTHVASIRKWIEHSYPAA